MSGTDARMAELEAEIDLLETMHQITKDLKSLREGMKGDVSTTAALGGTDTKFMAEQLEKLLGELGIKLGRYSSQFGDVKDFTKRWTAAVSAFGTIVSGAVDARDSTAEQQANALADFVDNLQTALSTLVALNPVIGAYLKVIVVATRAIGELLPQIEAQRDLREAAARMDFDAWPWPEKAVEHEDKSGLEQELLDRYSEHAKLQERYDAEVARRTEAVYRTKVSDCLELMMEERDLEIMELWHEPTDGPAYDWFRHEVDAVREGIADLKGEIRPGMSGDEIDDWLRRRGVLRRKQIEIRAVQDCAKGGEKWNDMMRRRLARGAAAAALVGLGIGAFAFLVGDDEQVGAGPGVGEFGVAGTIFEAPDDGEVVDPDGALDADAPDPDARPAQTPSPVEGGISPDLLGQFTLIGDGVVEFAYEGDRIIGRVVMPSRHTGIDLWGQLSLCTGDPEGGANSRTESSLVGDIVYDLDTFGDGRWFFFEQVPDFGFTRCQRLDDGESVSAIFTGRQVDALGTRPDGSMIGFSHTVPEEVFDVFVSPAATSQEPSDASDVRNQFQENACVATDLDELTPDVDAIRMVNIEEVHFRRDDTDVVEDYEAGGAMDIELDDKEAAGLPGGWDLEFGLTVRFGDFIEQGETILGGSEWQWFFPTIRRDGQPVTALPYGLGERPAAGTATARWANGAIEIAFPALPTLAAADSFSVLLATTILAADETATVCSDQALVDEVR